MLPTELLFPFFKEFYGETNNINNRLTIRTVGGGSINHAFLVSSKYGEIFVKINSNPRFPDFFEKEKLGLIFLSEKSNLQIPEVYSVYTFNGYQVIIMQAFKHVPNVEKSGFELGKGMAQLHCSTNDAFGLDYNNYIGTIPQQNSFRKDWTSFFYEFRAEPCLKLLNDKGMLSQECKKSVIHFSKSVSEIFPNEKPSALHGDLWSGNTMNTLTGPAIFDPAVYYGHREMDIGMTKLFGGFDDSFYQGYNELFPLEKGWQLRVEYAQVYPLLIHACLFGKSYLSSVQEILKPFRN
jgi:fructosamine-3-kinase